MWLLGRAQAPVGKHPPPPAVAGPTGGRLMRDTFQKASPSREEQSQARFLSFGTVDIWGWLTPRRGDRPVHGAMFGSVPGLHPLEAGAPHPQL